MYYPTFKHKKELRNGPSLDDYLASNKESFTYGLLPHIQIYQNINNGIQIKIIIPMVLS